MHVVEIVSSIGLQVADYEWVSSMMLTVDN